MSWLSMLPKLAKFGPPRITVAVTERLDSKHGHTQGVIAAQPECLSGSGCIGRSLDAIRDN